VVEYQGNRIAAALLPASPQMRSIRVVLRPASPRQDDDPIPGDLFDLWPAILSFRSAKPAAGAIGNHLYDIEDLHRAAQLLYGSDTDRNGNGTSDVDEIFVAHGFYGDTHGGVSNQQYDPRDTIGLTSHTEATVGGVSYPAMVPRATPPVLPELQARIDTGGVVATAVVNVEFADPRGDASFTSVLEPDAQGMVTLPIPPPDSGGTVSVMMLADGYRPAPALEVDPATFWAEADRHPGQSFLTATVTLAQGDPLLPDEAPTIPAPFDQGGFPTEALVVVLAVILGVGTLAWYRRPHRPA
jgi:hypothetical protein